ncbi:hypothetical protein L596_019507 [Steinernema carpocapsae]|uniref:Protein kinase domain-containing protein n=1 Tax=Steinernema carpocapsae TaxID=34508 RepID=A0A4U5MQQ3_STECR|nr:hypothetical protein L596_019507 [Steinernema carpocapsae]
MTLNNVFCLGEIFKKTKLLGTGGFGDVFLMGTSGRKIAAKTIRFEKGSRQRMAQKEIHVMSSLRHPHIVRFLDQRLCEESCTILMECMGGDLHTAVEFMGDEEKREVFGQLLGAVGYLHARGFAHCDLKPENVLVKNTAHVKICDFGGVRQIRFDVFGREFPQAGMIGTSDYEAPLKARHLPSTASKDDIWSLGLILYWIFAKDLPWNVAIEEDAHFRLWTEGVAPPAFKCLEPQVVEVLTGL